MKAKRHIILVVSPDATKYSKPCKPENGVTGAEEDISRIRAGGRRRVVKGGIETNACRPIPFAFGACQ